MGDKLVLGLGGTVDYEIVWDSSVLEELVEEYSIRSSELSPSVPVTSERDLVVSILGFVKDGVGGERYVASSDIIEKFAARFEKRITMGGTPVRAAIAMRSIGVTSLLHLVSIDDHVRRLLPSDLAYICSAQQDTTDPHLIVQYPQGTRVRAADVVLTAPHPNRLIYANDPPNRELVLSDELGGALEDAAIFMVSGFNVIRETSVLDQRVQRLREHMRSLPSDALVYYEDAEFHVEGLSERVRSGLIDLIDVYSLNEDEMQVYLGRTVDLLSAEQMVAALHELRALIPAPILVVHTKYWALALGDGARNYERALRGGITMAATRYRHGDVHGEQEYAQTGRSPSHAAGAEFARLVEERIGVEVRCLPAYVTDAESPTTIGLGDSFAGGFIAALAASRGHQVPATGTEPAAQPVPAVGS